MIETWNFFCVAFSLNDAGMVYSEDLSEGWQFFEASRLARSITHCGWNYQANKIV